MCQSYAYTGVERGEVHGTLKPLGRARRGRQRFIGSDECACATASCSSVSVLDLEDDGTVQVESYTQESLKSCQEAIMKIVEESDSKKREKKEPEGPPPEIGVIYRDCEVKGVHNFGVFVEILPGYEGLVHVSELDVKKIPNPAAAGIEGGQKLDVKFLGKNEKGQMRLSRRQVLLRDAGGGGGGGNDGGEGSTPAVSVSAATSTAAAADAYSS